MIKTVTDASFRDDVIAAPGPVLVDFWAEWCGPCRVVSPALEEIARESGDALVLAKVDVDSNPETASRYGIRSIPALLLFDGGEILATRVGAAPKSDIRYWIEAALKAK